ncbi:MAG TPA: Crp/Fnr family transcriptional regulator [Steroidobacteraceae bacterium]|nr:Crp/Fnr family transcriptional regulator [Steroidobacteraceae bacterium]
MPDSAHSTPGNQLLMSLPQPLRGRLLARLEPVELRMEQVLSKPGERMRHVFFPTQSFISLIVPLDGHAGLEVGLVGDEGMVGISSALDIAVSPMHTLVQGPGAALRMETAAFINEIKRSPPLQKLLDRYLYVTLIQLAQSGACTRFHLVEARLARWLLMTRDRAHADEFCITHVFLSHMLGVRRAGITRAAGALRKRNLIHYSRGVLTIIDGAALEKAACSCYATHKKDYARMLG